MNNPVKVALVGLGWWGQKMLSVLEGAQTKIKIVHAVEPDTARVESLCADRGLPLSPNLADILGSTEIEAVILATPHSFHESQIREAAIAGKHVFCEKPLALTKESALRSVEVCAREGVVLGMGHEKRWEPPIADLLAQVDTGVLGRVHQIEANFSHNKFLTLDRDNWRLKGDQSPASGMTATGIHLLDLSVRLLGRAESVLCVCESLSSDLPQGDTVGAYIKFTGGGTSYVSASLANPFVSRFAVFGSKGWIEVRDKAHVEAPEGWLVTQSAMNGPIVMHEVEPSEPVKDNLVSFADAVRGLGSYPITAEHLVNNIALLEAVIASANSGGVEMVS